MPINILYVPGRRGNSSVLMILKHIYIFYIIIILCVRVITIIFGCYHRSRRRNSRGPSRPRPSANTAADAVSTRYRGDDAGMPAERHKQPRRRRPAGSIPPTRTAGTMPLDREFDSSPAPPHPQPLYFLFLFFLCPGEIRSECVTRM